jgi:hypothetical protein
MALPTSCCGRRSRYLDLGIKYRHAEREIVRCGGGQMAQLPVAGEYMF